IASTTSNIAVDIAGNKEETKMLLDAAQIPVPRGTVVRTDEGLNDAIGRFGYPLVVKPIDGNHGKGNTTNITTYDQAIKAFEETNKDSRRGYGHEKVLTQITVDQFTQKMLDDHGYTLETIPPKDELVILKPTANLSTGGTSTDVTDEVHPANIFMFERIARIV